MNNSKYNIFYYDELNKKYAIYNLLSGSFILMTDDKISNKKIILEKCTKDELNSLEKMGFITQINEFNKLEETRKKYLETRDSNIWNIVILTTTNCNARCYYCYEHKIEHHTLTCETADKIIKYIVDNIGDKKLKISWFGGEPLFNKKIINYICSKLIENNVDFYTSMISNGYLFKYVTVEELKNWRLTNVQITIDSIYDEYNKIKDYIYKDVDAFSIIIENIKFLISNNIFVTIRINFDSSNLDNTKKILKYFYENFKNERKLSVYCANIVDGDMKCPIEIEGQNPYVEIYSLLFDYGYINNIKQFKLRQKLVDCSIYDPRFLIINPNGDLFKCEHALVNSKYKIGNIFSDKLNNEERQFWEEFRYPYEDCKDCICLPICEGGCKYYSLTERKNITCIQIKNCLEDIVGLYYKKKVLNSNK